METISRRIERIEKQGKPVVLGVKSCKTYRKALETLIGQQYKNGRTELEFYTRGLLEIYNKFHPEVIETGIIKGWKGKSGIINIEKLPDKVIITRMQKPNKNEAPREVKIEIEQYQLETILRILNKLNNGELIKTKHIAMAYSIALDLGHHNWKEFFADRKQHNLLTNILGYLDSENIIEYSGGTSKILSLTSE